jgi:hypothetical protein
MNFQEETLAEVWIELQVLLPLNYEELTLNKDHVKLDPDWNRYQCMSDNSELSIFTARDGVELVGYAFFFVLPHIHYKNLVVANNDVLFLKKEYRTGMTGIKFLKYCDEQLKSRCDKITWHIKDTNDFSPLLKRMGYSVEDTIMGKIC